MEKQRLVLQIETEKVSKLNQAADKCYIKRNAFLIQAGLEKAEKILNV